MAPVPSAGSTWHAPKWLRWPAHAPAWSESLNLVGPRVRTASWSWVLLLAGLTAVAWVAPDVVQLDEEEARLLADRQRLQRAQHQIDLRQQAARKQVSAQASQQRSADPAPRAALGPVWPDRSTAQLAPIGQWLGYPWLQTLAQADAAARQTQARMLGFSLDLSSWDGLPATQPLVRMSAAVPDDAAALRWAQALGPQAQLISRERLGASATSTAVDQPLGPVQARAEVSWPGVRPAVIGGAP